MDYGMKYEMLIRKVFNCDRLGDPAKEANAGYFNDTAIRSVKIMLGYCTLYLASKTSGSESMEVFCSSLLQSIQNAKNIDDLKSVVDDLSQRI